MTCLATHFTNLFGTKHLSNWSRLPKPKSSITFLFSGVRDSTTDEKVETENLVKASLLGSTEIDLVSWQKEKTKIILGWAKNKKLNRVKKKEKEKLPHG